ncbi:MAG: hypothetical protein HN758_10660 [Verrucomicrobia bacterium]|nr:hypothetical protein [Verrucomicrobiota bacterium]
MNIQSERDSEPYLYIWKSMPGETKLQVHDPESAKKIARIRGVRLSGFNVVRPYLRLFTLPWSVRRTRDWVKRNLKHL